jgi:hypothetical protein
MMVKWSCASVLCFNNYASKDSSGQLLKFYRLPRLESVQKIYMKLFMTSGMNWENGHICGDHWSKERENSNVLPDIIIPENQYEKICEKHTLAKKTFDSYKNPNEKLKLRYKTAKRKFEVATQIKNSTPQKLRNVPLRDGSTPVVYKKKELSKKQSKKKLNFNSIEINRLKTDLEEANEKIKVLQNEICIKNIEVAKSKSKYVTSQKYIAHLKSEEEKSSKKDFNYKNLIERPKLFHYLCGLSVEQFQIILDCVSPYTHLIPYPDCDISMPARRSIDVETELLSVLTLCRHGLHQGVMAFIIQKSKSTMQRIFIGWVIFLSTFLNEIDLKPASGFLLKKMPESFIKTGHGLTDIVIDATEFKFQSASNYELNSLMFSNYKNTQTGKALIGISPHGGGILFSDIYPGSISDSEITEKSNTLLFVEKDHEIMSDRGFSIQDFCAAKGVSLNRPKFKDSDQFTQGDVAKNFDIAATRIHVERFIGRIRDWGIMNTVWPINQIDILSSTWQMLGHIVNLTMLPIGPKEQ